MTDAQNKPAENTTQAKAPATTEYVLLDKIFYKRIDGKMKKFSQGQLVPLTPNEADTLLEGERPSVRKQDKEDKKEENS